MKIEKVTFENINSLAGHFEVDFTHPSLADGGIFVISGSTGSGKTSLLDAISFALYGKTARQDAVSNSVNELMTRGAQHCMAEVQFEKDGLRYVVRSFQRRRRGRTEDSQPFSPIERGLSTLAEDGTVSPFGEQKVRNVNDSVEELTGLTPSNFYRCMMLAQGQFSRFLQAGEKERSEVLATITGTEIYQRIGEVVHEHKAALERELESRQRREVLSPEKREATVRSRDEAQAAMEELSAKGKTLAEAAAWLQSLAGAVEACGKSQAALQEAEAAMAEFQSSGAQGDLQLAEAAQAVAPAFTAKEAAQKSLAACRQSIMSETAYLQELTPTLQAAEDAEKAAHAELDGQEPVIQTALTRLREVIRPLEQEAAQARTQADNARAAATLAASQAQSAAQTAAESATREKEAKEALAAAGQALEAVQADAALAEHLPTLNTRFKDWQAATRRHGAREDEAPEPTAELRRRLQEQKAARAEILAGGTRADLATRKEALTRLQDRQNGLAHAEEAMAAAEKKVAAAQEALAALPPLAPAQQCVDTLTTARDALKDCSTLGEQLAKLCRDFQEGVLSACPCCGNTVPPESLPHPLSAELTSVEGKLKLAKEALRDLQGRHDRAQRALSQAQGQAEVCIEALQKARTAQADALAALGLAETPADLPARIAAAANALQRLDDVEEAIAALEVLLDIAGKRDTFLQELAPCCADTPAHVAAAKGVLTALTTHRQTFDTLAEALRKATVAVSLAEQQARNDASAHTTAQETSAKAQEASAAAEAAAKEIEDKLLAEHGEEPSATTEAKLQERLDSLRKAYNAAHEAAEAVRAKRAAHEPVLRQEREKEPALDTEAAQAESDFARALEAHGLADAEAFAAARTKIPALAGLRARREGLAKVLAGAESQAALTQKQLADLQAKQLTTLTPEALELEIQGNEAQHTQQENLYLELRTLLNTDDEARAFNDRLEGELEGKRRELDDWTMLADVLGRSKDGFKRYAQKITFNLLISYANAQLRDLNDRYTLEQGEEVLSLYVRDRYQDDEARSCSNLSGGESFVVSLALALGLSRMSGRTRIDSLFLDEGFGTLDEDTLSHVLAYLQTLRADGKQVGIISHVPRLKNEIRSLLEVRRRAVSSLSTFAPHPAVIANPGELAIPNSPEARKQETLARHREAVLAALAAIPTHASREKELRTATGIDGLRNILAGMVEAGLLSRTGNLYSLPDPYLSEFPGKADADNILA